MPEFARDPELYAQPTTWPGGKLPHTWVTNDGRRTSTLDLGGHGTFSLWTGIGGAAWVDAADEYAAATGLPITVVSVGPGEAIEDPYGTWAELREIGDAGCWWCGRTSTSRRGTWRHPRPPSPPPTGSARPSPRSWALLSTQSNILVTLSNRLE